MLKKQNKEMSSWKIEDLPLLQTKNEMNKK
jgi:hypothetical protein